MSPYVSKGTDQSGLIVAGAKYFVGKHVFSKRLVLK